MPPEELGASTDYRYSSDAVVGILSPARRMSVSNGSSVRLGFELLVFLGNRNRWRGGERRGQTMHSSGALNQHQVRGWQLRNAKHHSALDRMAASGNHNRIWSGGMSSPSDSLQ
ncbi:hypothetical protein FRC12_000902 [Ceratobasidium sp. 428]|nr:hypothetical protein FRC12_000902 [Ceratobasidium sp. 428]